MACDGDGLENLALLAQHRNNGALRRLGRTRRHVEGYRLAAGIAHAGPVEEVDQLDPGDRIVDVLRQGTGGFRDCLARLESQDNRFEEKLWPDCSHVVWYEVCERGTYRNT